MAKPVKPLSWKGTPKDNVYNLHADKFIAGALLNGRGGFDTVQLDSGISVDFSLGTLASIEALAGAAGNESVSMLATQWTSFSTIDLGLGTDTLSIYASGDISALGMPLLANVEVGNLIGTTGDDSIKLTGSQLDAIVIGSGSINLGDGVDTIALTSPSAVLNALGAVDTKLQGVEVIDVSSSASGVSIDLSGQTEGFTILGTMHEDTIQGGAGDDIIYALGDLDFVSGNYFGDEIFGGIGNDQLFAKGIGSLATGDMRHMDGTSIGGNDHLTLLADANPPSNFQGNDSRIFGDAVTMAGTAVGGNDVLRAEAGTLAGLIGDAAFMSEYSKGGDDTCYGPDGTVNSVVIGDAWELSGHAKGGNDRLYSGVDSFGYGTGMSGDASSMRDFAVGGDDVLVSGDGSGHALYGDAAIVSGSIVCGNDVLVSANGNDTMWGDVGSIDGVAVTATSAVGNVVTGSDRFVFLSSSGNDQIIDFRQSDHDVVDVSAFSEAAIASMVVDGNGTNTTIHFDASNSVTLVGFTDPSALQYDSVNHWFL